MLYQKNIVKPNSNTMIVHPASSELLVGMAHLEINQDADFVKTFELKRFLVQDARIKIISTGGLVGRGSWIRLFMRQPVPLFQVLYRAPDVQEVARRGRQIYIIFT